jgi:hypothetical protein
MRTALAEDGREATARFRYKALNAEDYFPHLWLGLSLEKLGEPGRALVALRESDRQGAVAERPALKRILSAALVRLTPPTPAPTTPTPPTPTPEAAAVPTPPAAAPTAVPAIGTPVRPAPTRPPVSPAAATPASPAPSSSAVRAGARAFFRGDYAGAERLLAPEAGTSAVARLFLAWSLGGRYLLSPEPDATLLARARAEYAAALVAGAPAAGSPHVSPAIRALFEGNGAAR